jgi:hypothetical protein
MQLLSWTRSLRQLPPTSHLLLRLALVFSFSVTGLGQLLRTVPAQFSAHPVLQSEHWVAGSLMTLPLFAAGVWAGDLAAHRMGLSTAKKSGVCKLALVMAFGVALALVPLWFERNKVDSQARAQALVTPHSHGGVDVYWLPPAVIVALVCVCGVPAALWAGRGIAARVAARLPRGRRLLVPTFAVTVTVAAAPALAWLLYQVAEHAYASQVDYTSAAAAVRVHSHAFFGEGYRPPRVPVPAAPFAFARQLAHALQDGLAGQAAGLPAAAVTLLWATRGQASGSGTGRHTSTTGRRNNEQARPAKP